MRNFTQTWQTNWSKKLNKYVPVLAVVIIFGGLGTTFLLTSHAATPTASVESENGAVSSAASSVTDSTASNGHAVKFGSGSMGTGSTCTGFPDASCTGVPSGTSLAAWTGSYTISTCQTISGKLFSQSVTITASNGSSDLNNPCVVIKNSKFTDSITTGSWPNTNYGPTLLQNDEVDMGTNADPSAIFGDNVKVVAANVHGGKANVQCADGNCEVDDSWLHNPYLTGAYHYDVVGTNGATGFVINHNTLDCSFDYPNSGSGTGGCSADLGLFGDSGTISHITINNNLFKGKGIQQDGEPGFCLITNANKPGKAYPVGDNLVVTNNVFERGSNGDCGQYGPVDEWQSGNGNVWTGNTWDDGTALNE